MISIFLILCFWYHRYNFIFLRRSSSSRQGGHGSPALRCRIQLAALVGWYGTQEWKWSGSRWMVRCCPSARWSKWFFSSRHWYSLAGIYRRSKNPPQQWTYACFLDWAWRATGSYRLKWRSLSFRRLPSAWSRWAPHTHRWRSRCICTSRCSCRKWSYWDDQTWVWSTHSC